MSEPALHLVSPRRPRADGQGDQRRAQQILEALGGTCQIIVHSWLPDAGVPATRGLLRSPAALVRFLLLALIRPLQVASVQALAPAEI